MTTVTAIPRFFRVLCACLIVLTGCGGGDPGEEGGLIGTGIIGTISENKVLASESVEIKASSGEKSTAALNRDRRYTAGNLQGDAPFLIRSDLGNSEYRYAIAYSTGTISNVHSYSDAILRFWFQDQFVDIDSAFNNDEPLSALPTQDQFDLLSANLFSAVSLVLDRYGFTREQILSASYKADDRGIDAYLDNNPVVIEGSQISIVVTDPDTQYQSETTAVLSLDPSQSATGGGDTSSPTVVQNVRALGSSTTEVVVVWDPATDNVGVIGYQVERDGVLVATTPFPVFTDTNLQPGSFPVYTVIALDGSGNTAPASAPVTGRTLFDEDNEPPPVPTRITQVEATPSRVVLQWTISNISDVVAFNVYRAASDQPSALLLRSTSTEMTDTSVTGGIEYCYRVEAVDAAGNTSGQTEDFCVTTQGTAIGATNQSSVSVGGLNVPEVDNISCSAVFPATIPEDAVFAEPCYLVNADVEITGFADVDIAAGTVLKFAQGTGLLVTANASLSVNGLTESPVIFTGQEDVRGFWRGITYDQTESEDNQVVNAVIEYAGQGQLAALAVNSFEGSRSRIRLQGSLIRNNAWTGVRLNAASTRLDLFDGNTMTENRFPAYISPLLLSSISANNTFTGNEIDEITVPRLGIDTDTVFPDLGVALRNYGITLTNADLTIDAGVEIIFGPGISMFVEDDSNLIVNGTADNPVLFTSSVRGAGEWGGVHLTDSPDSRLEGLIIEYGGEPVARYNANLALDNSSVTLKDVTLRNSSGYGYFADENSQVTDLGNVQQTNNALQ